MANEKKVDTTEVKIEKNVKIELTNGSEKFLADLTEADLLNVKLNEKDEKTWLTMKSENVRQDADYVYETRMFKWSTMPKLAIYTLKRPKSLKKMVADLTEKKVFELAMNNYAIEQDKANNGITGKVTDPNKLVDKIEASLIASGMSKEQAAVVAKQTREAMKLAGFGK